MPPLRCRARPSAVTQGPAAHTCALPAGRGPALGGDGVGWGGAGQPKTWARGRRTAVCLPTAVCRERRCVLEQRPWCVWYPPGSAVPPPKPPAGAGRALGTACSAVSKAALCYRHRSCHKPKTQTHKSCRGEIELLTRGVFCSCCACSRICHHCHVSSILIPSIT